MTQRSNVIRFQPYLHIRNLSTADLQRKLEHLQLECEIHNLNYYHELFNGWDSQFRMAHKELERRAKRKQPTRSHW